MSVRTQFLEVPPPPLQVNKAERKLIASELAFLTQQLAEKLQEGDVVEGVVSSCQDFGAFVKLGSGKTLQGVEVREVFLPCARKDARKEKSQRLLQHKPGCES